MTRRLTLLFSAFEALLVAAIGVAIPLLLATVLWAAHFGFAPDWAGFWRASVDVWLIGHGVDVTFVLDEATAASIGVPAETVVGVTIAALGFALLTLLLGVRAGSRVHETGHPLLGVGTALAVFAGLSFLLALSASHPDARPSLAQGAFLPPLAFGLGLLLGVLRAWAAESESGSGYLPRWWRARVAPLPRLVIGTALRAGSAAVALTLLVSSVVAAIVIGVGYAQAIRMYETLHTEVLGGIVLTLGQLAFVPNLVIWAASWFVGPGFALGVGSQVSPLGTSVGPLPAIPLLGVLPTGELDYGFVGLVVPVLAGFLAGIAVRPAFARGLGEASRGWFAAAALGGALMGGMLFGVLAAASAGSLGPGRFTLVGPDPLAVGTAVALEFAIGIGLGFASALLPRVVARLLGRDER